MTASAPGGRDPAIDALRGVALFAILFVNIELFAFGTVFPTTILPDWPDTADRLAQAAVNTFVTGKFIVIFAFLFGWGALVQIVRDEAGPARFRRRLAAFAVIGALHFVLLSLGDIVSSFAFVGLLLIRSAAWQDGRLARNALVWLAAVVAMQVVLAAPTHLWPDAVSTDEAEALRRQAVFATGALPAILAQHLRDAAAVAWMPLVQALIVVPFARLGFLAARRAAERDPTQEAPGGAAMREAIAPWAVRRFAIAGLIVNGLCGMVIFASDDIVLRNAAFTVTGAIGGVLLAPLYARLLLDLFADPRRARLRDGFAAVGRMSLSVYVGQSVLAALVFYGYGLGLHGRVGPAAVAGAAIAINLAAFALAIGWSRMAGQGPLERLLVLAGGHRRIRQGIAS